MQISETSFIAINDSTEWDVSSINDWICRCELNYSLADPNLSTILLACFVCEGRSFFEGSLFIFQFVFIDFLGIF